MLLTSLAVHSLPTWPQARQANNEADGREMTKAREIVEGLTLEPFTD
jgi:hypothetical protein